MSGTGSKKIPDNIVIDLKKQTIKVPEVEPTEPDSIFYHNVSHIGILYPFTNNDYCSCF